MPADNNLRRGFAVFICQIANDFLIENAFPPCANGLRIRSGFCVSRSRRVAGVVASADEVQSGLSQASRSFINQALQVMDLEVAHADAFD